MKIRKEIGAEGLEMWNQTSKNRDKTERKVYMAIDTVFSFNIIAAIKFRSTVIIPKGNNMSYIQVSSIHNNLKSRCGW